MPSRKATPDPPANARSRFSDRVGDYVATRPSYPGAAVDAVLEGLGEPASLVVADVGAGTGIFSRLLADRGCRVLAVEPNAEMRGAIAPHPAINPREGSGESTGLDDASVDLVTVAQAFHWMRPREALAEFRRVLKPDGRVALVWNVQDRSDRTTDAYCAAMERFATEMPRSPWAMAETATALVGAEGFSPPRVLVFPFEQRLDADALIGRAMSASYAPKEGAAHGALLDALRDLHARHADSGGAVTLRYRTEVHLAQSLPQQR